MFFKIKDGPIVIQFGTGDVAVSKGVFKDISPHKCVTIEFRDIDPGKIGRELHNFTNIQDFKKSVGLRFIFTNPKSIDVVINELKQAKKLMLSSDKNEDNK